MSIHSEKKIALDFSTCRRTSFLPYDLAVESIEAKRQEASLKAINVVEREEDSIFMPMHYDKSEVKPMKKFCTGSKYLGQWNRLGFTGKGVYKYPHGVIYDGYFNKKGEFHGSGILVYPNGQKIEGIWKNGKLSDDCTFVTEAGVAMNKNYCLIPDRRFQIEIEKDLAPANQEFLTNEQPPARNIPPNCYDIVEGFFDPNLKAVYEYPKIKPQSKFDAKFSFSKDEEKLVKTQAKTERVLMGSQGIVKSSKISWIPSLAQETWIIKNCRRAWDEPTRYIPDLYEEWTKGGNDFYERLERRYSGEFVSALETLQLMPSEKQGSNKKDSNLVTFVKNRKEEIKLIQNSSNTLRDKFKDQKIYKNATNKTLRIKK